MVQDLMAVMSSVGYKPLASHGETLIIFMLYILLILRFFLLVGCHIRDEIFDKNMFLFYYLDVVLLSFFFLQSKCLASPRGPFRVFCSICSCLLAVSEGRGDHRVFLHPNLNPLFRQSFFTLSPFC